MDYDGELFHLIVQAVRHVLGDRRPGAIGHAIDYDPKLHAIRVTAPGYPVVDDQGNPTGEFGQTGWLQMATLEGHQAAPHIGDASALTGDQYYIFILERNEGTAISVAKTYNDKEQPPFQDLLPGEWGYKNRDCSTFVRFHQGGMVEVVGANGQSFRYEPSGDPTGSIRMTASKNGSRIVLQGPGSPQSVVLDTDGSVRMRGIGSGEVLIDSLGNILIATTGNTNISLVAPSILLGGNPAAPAVARVGDLVTVDGTPGGTVVGKIATGSAITQCN